jgi:hypothetical protein
MHTITLVTDDRQGLIAPKYYPILDIEEAIQKYRQFIVMKANGMPIIYDNKKYYIIGEVNLSYTD